MLLFVPVSFKKRLEESWKAAPDKDGYDEIIEFYENGFLIKRSDAEVKYLYEQFAYMVEKSGYLFFGMSKNHAYMIQKSSCSEELLAFLNQKF